MLVFWFFLVCGLRFWLNFDLSWLDLFCISPSSSSCTLPSDYYLIVVKAKHPVEVEIVFEIQTLSLYFHTLSTKTEIFFIFVFVFFSVFLYFFLSRFSDLVFHGVMFLLSLCLDILNWEQTKKHNEERKREHEALGNVCLIGVFVTLWQK